MHIHRLTCACYVPCQPQFPWLDELNYTWRRVEVVHFYSVIYSTFIEVSLFSPLLSLPGSVLSVMTHAFLTLSVHDACPGPPFLLRLITLN